MKAGGSRLAGLTKELRAQWQDTKNYWKDAKSQEFEDGTWKNSWPAWTGRLQ